MREIDWSGPALEDLAAIDIYWCVHSPSRADAILDAVRGAGLFLAGTPWAGPQLGDVETRKWRVRGTDYVLLYRVVGATLRVLRVHHVRENWRPEA